MGDYLPSTDADLDLWILNFSTLLTAAPATYGLLAGDATAVATQYTAWHAAYLAAINPATRTPVTVAAKDTAKTTALAVIRPYATQISNNAGVTSGNKIAIGVNPQTDTGTPIAPPTTYPVLSIDAIQPLQHIMRYRDQAAPLTSRAKPEGVQFFELRAKVSATVITDQNDLPIVGLQTKAPFAYDLDNADVGKQIYYCGRWLNPAGEPGPFSAIISATVANAA